MKHPLKAMLFRSPSSSDLILRFFPCCLPFLFFFPIYLFVCLSIYLFIWLGTGPEPLGCKSIALSLNCTSRLLQYILMLLNTSPDENLMEEEIGTPSLLRVISPLHNQGAWMIKKKKTTWDFVSQPKADVCPVSLLGLCLMDATDATLGFEIYSYSFSNSFLFSLIILSYNSNCLLELVPFKNWRHFQTLRKQNCLQKLFQDRTF